MGLDGSIEAAKSEVTLTSSSTEASLTNPALSSTSSVGANTPAPNLCGTPNGPGADSFAHPTWPSPHVMRSEYGGSPPTIDPSRKVSVPGVTGLGPTETFLTERGASTVRLAEAFPNTAVRAASQAMAAADRTMSVVTPLPSPLAENVVAEA